MEDRFIGRHNDKRVGLHRLHWHCVLAVKERHEFPRDARVVIHEDTWNRGRVPGSNSVSAKAAATGAVATGANSESFGQVRRT